MHSKVDPNSPAARLRAALQATNRSASEVARICGFSRQNMQRFLDGEIDRSKHFPLIAKALDVSLTWLLTGDSTVAPSWSAASRRREDPRSSRDAADRSGAPAYFPQQWTIETIPSGMVVELVLPETQVICDPERTPVEGDLVLIPSKDGHRLRRLGPTIAGRIVLTAVDGSGAVESRATALSRTTTVVVGVLLPKRKG